MIGKAKSFHGVKQNTLERMRIRLEEPELLLAWPALSEPRVSLGGRCMRKISKLGGDHLFYVRPFRRGVRGPLSWGPGYLCGDYIVDLIGMHAVILCFRKAEKAHEERSTN